MESKVTKVCPGFPRRRGDRPDGGDGIGCPEGVPPQARG